jgi:hypothetical protein
MIVIPSDFEIDESNNALVSFVRETYSDRNNKRISKNLKVQVGQGDPIEVHLDQDELVRSPEKDFPAEITVQMNTTKPANNEGS